MRIKYIQQLVMLLFLWYYHVNIAMNMIDTEKLKLRERKKERFTKRAPVVSRLAMKMNLQE